MLLNLFSCHFALLFHSSKFCPLLPSSLPLSSPPLSSLSSTFPPLPPSLFSPLSTAHDRDVWQATFCLQEGGRHYGYREEIPWHLLQGCFLWQGRPCNMSTSEYLTSLFNYCNLFLILILSYLLPPPPPPPSFLLFFVNLLFSPSLPPNKMDSLAVSTYL